MNKLVLCFFSLTGLCFADSLEQVVAQTLSVHPDLQIVTARVRNSELAASEAFNSYFPVLQINAQSGFGTAAEPLPDFVSNSEQQISILVRQPLFTGFANRSNLQRLNYELASEYAERIQVSNDIAMEAVEAYMAVLLATEELQLLERRLTTEQQLAQQVQQQSDSGLVPVSDFFRANSQLATTNADLTAARQNLLLANEQFLRTVGQVPPPQLIKPVVDQRQLEAISASEEGREGHAFRNHPTLLEAQADADAALAQQALARRDYFPDISLEAALLINDDLQEDSSARVDSEIRLTLSYQFGKSTLERLNEKRAASERLQAEEIQRKAKLEVIEQVRTRWAQVNAYREQLAWQQQQVEYDTQTVQAYREQYRLGRQTPLEVLNVELSLYQARRQYLNVEKSYLESQYQLLAAHNQLLPALAITLPELE